jgi:hypothetical protein
MAIINGTAGNDELYAKKAGDELVGLEGNDIIDAVAIGEGDNTLRGGAGDDTLYGKIRDRLFGEADNDVLNAKVGQGNNQLFGGEGDDTLYAGSNDELNGGAGNDRLFAGKGNNTLTGGSAADLFWLALASLPTQSNTVLDFTQGEDKLGIAVTDLTFEDLDFLKQDNDTLIKTKDGREIARLAGFQGTLEKKDITDKEIILPRPPVFVTDPDSASVNSNGSVTIDVLKNDSGSNLAIESFDLTTTKGGKIELNDNGTAENKSDDLLVYKPNPNTFNFELGSNQGLFRFDGDYLTRSKKDGYTDSFNYTVKDDSGSLKTQTVSVDVKSNLSLKFMLESNDAAYVNEIGVFKVDADGAIGGIKPGEPGYLKAALESGKVIFSSSGDIKELLGSNPTRVLDGFSSSDNLNFFLVQNNSVDNALKAIQSGEVPPNVFFASSNANTNDDSYNHLRTSGIQDGFQLSWEDFDKGGDGDFNDLVMNVQLTNEAAAIGAKVQSNPQRELLDLSGQSSLKANFQLSSDAGFNNTVGFYQVLDAEGTVDISGKLFKPGDVGYAQAAIEKRVTPDISKTNNNVSTDLPDGAILAPFIIADGTPEQFLNTNAANNLGSNPVAYFTYLGANPDGADHVRSLGDNYFGFEDLSANIADSDFNDVIVKVNFS